MLSEFFKHWNAEYNAEIEKLRFSLLNIANLLALVTISVFAIINFDNEEFFLSFFQILLSISILINILMYRRYGKYHITSFFTILLIYIQIILLYYLGGINNTGIYWLMIFPILVFILKGRWLGMVWVSALIATLLLSIILNYFSIISIVYPAFNVIVVIICISIITMMMYSF